MSSDAQMPDMASPAPSQTSYAPSVPISVYRELAAELQATKAMLDSLNTQNLHLAQQNQALRQEVEKVVQTALQARQVADAAHPLWQQSAGAEPLYREAPSGRPPGRSQRPSPSSESARPAKPRPVPPPISVSTQTHVIEQEDRPSWANTLAQRSSELSGIWLAVAIGLIVITAFGAGFLIVRPFLQQSR